MIKYITYYKIIFSAFVSFFVLQVNAQQENILVGTLSLEGDVNYTYKLQFRDSSGFISGYSVTDVGGPDQTKTAITGTLNVFRKELQFRETHIISTKSAVPQDSFCYVQARLRLTGMKKGKALKGSFTGYKPGGKEQCAKGSITLYSAVDVLDRLMKTPGADTIVKAIQQKMKTADTALHSTIDIVQLQPGKRFDGFYEGKSATLEIWDDKDIDGDMVTIKRNNETVLERYVLSEGKKQVVIPMPGTQADTITIFAESEGTQPPNTAMVKVASGNFLYYINAHTSFDKPVQIILKPKGR